MPLTAIRRERRLPGPGTVTVRINEKVQPADIVGEAEVSPHHTFLDISRGLGVSEREVPRYLRREIGGRVEADEIIAGPVGIARRSIRAPSDGRLVSLSGGRVLFEARSSPYRLRAGMPGSVVGTDASSVVSIETTGALIQGVWGNGVYDWGVLRQIGEGPSERLLPDKMDIILRGSVLIAGVCEDAPALREAAELSVRGLILGSMASSLLSVAKNMPYPIILTDGFGEVPMHTPAFNLLISNVGREVTVNAGTDDLVSGQHPEVIIPLPATSAVEISEGLVQLKPGVRVRALRRPHAGAVGQVREVLSGALAMPSGIMANCARVELEGIGAAVIPVSNLEVLK